MLNRRILRIKAFKTLYGCVVAGETSLEKATEELDASIQATRDLYLFMLNIIPALARESSARQASAKTKFSATEEELNPNVKFSENSLSKLFAEDTDFQKLVTKKHLDWSQYDLIVKGVLDSMTARKYFSDYMSSGTSSLKEDCKLFQKVFSEEFMDRDDLLELLEDKSLYWTADELAYALSACCRTFQDIAKEHVWKLPELYLSDMVKKKKPSADVSSDKEFVHKLFSRAFTGYERYSQMVVSSVPEWDSDRLFSTDMALIALGLAEVENFPEIPDSVSINEYVEISKYYSSPKSRQFVNGLLDKLVKQIRNSD